MVRPLAGLQINESWRDIGQKPLQNRLGDFTGERLQILPNNEHVKEVFFPLELVPIGIKSPSEAVRLDSYGQQSHLATHLVPFPLKVRKSDGLALDNGFSDVLANLF